MKTLFVFLLLFFTKSHAQIRTYNSYLLGRFNGPVISIGQWEIGMEKDGRILPQMPDTFTLKFFNDTTAMVYSGNVLTGQEAFDIQGRLKYIVMYNGDTLFTHLYKNFNYFFPFTQIQYPYRKIIYELNEDKNLLKSYTENEYDTSFTYFNLQGRVMETESVFRLENSENFHRISWSYKYDNYGNDTLIHRIDNVRGTVEAHEKYRVEYKYDSNGNWVERKESYFGGWGIKSRKFIYKEG